MRKTRSEQKEVFAHTRRTKTEAAESDAMIMQVLYQIPTYIEIHFSFAMVFSGCNSNPIM